MIHNVQSGVYGDSEALAKEASELERLNSLIAERLSQRSIKTVEDIRGMMSKETWSYGQEIVDLGFADELIQTGTSPNKTNAISAVKKMKSSYMGRSAAAQNIKINNEG